jgi:hypothetical protein
MVLDLFSRFKNEILTGSVKAIELIFPPLWALNIKDVIGWFSQFSTNFFLFNSFYSIAYVIIILYFTVIIFNKKKFE